MGKPLPPLGILTPRLGIDTFHPRTESPIFASETKNKRVQHLTTGAYEKDDSHTCRYTRLTPFPIMLLRTLHRRASSQALSGLRGARSTTPATHTQAAQTLK